MKMLKHIGGEVDLENLGWDLPEELNLDIKNAITNHGYCSFGIVFSKPDGSGSDGYGNPQVEDPLTLQFITGINDGLWDEPAYSFSLNDVWHEFLDGAEPIAFDILPNLKEGDSD